MTSPSDNNENPEVNTHQTRAWKRSEDFKTVIDDILEFDESVKSSLKNQGISSVADMLSLSDLEISGLIYKNDDNEEHEILPFYVRSKIRILQAWNFRLLSKLGIKNIDWLYEELVTSYGCDTFRVSDYEPNVPVKQSLSKYGDSPQLFIPPTRSNNRLKQDGSTLRDFGIVVKETSLNMQF